MNKLHFKMDQDVKTKCYWAMALGVGACLISFFVAPVRFWANLLINNFYYISLALSGLFFLALQNVTGSSWMRTYQRIPQAMTSFLPYGLGLMLLTYFGFHTIYEWTHEHIVLHDPILIKKIAYLNIPFFLARMCLFFVLWIGFSKIISYLIDNWKNAGSPLDGSRRLAKYSAIFLIVFALTFSFASFDWIMSIEPHWFSTIFAVYTFSGLFVGGIAFITLSIIALHSLGYLQDYVTQDHLHDLGKWMFGMSTFWAYIWFCQYMLIWYSNIPEETEYFILREHHNWDWIFWFNLIINWIIPFIVLLPRNSKRSIFVLTRVSILLLVGRWVDLDLMIAPKIFEQTKTSSYIGPIEIFMAIGFAGLFVYIFLRALSKKKIIVEHDPYFEEGLHLHQ